MSHSPQVEANFKAYRARYLQSPVDNWLRRMQPKNSVRLASYFPTLEKMFDRGEIAYNNENWRGAFQDSLKVALFIDALRKNHHGWSQKANQKETRRAMRVTLPACIHYAEQCIEEIKNEMEMELEAKLARAQYQQEMERERAREAAEAAARKTQMLRDEALRAREQGEHARAVLAAAQAEEAAVDSAAAYAVVVGHEESGSSGSSGTSHHGMNGDASAVVVAAEVVGDGEVPLAPPPTLQTLQALETPLYEGQDITYQKNTVTLPATIVQIHREDPEAEYYTIRLPGNLEKQTTRQYIHPVVSVVPPPPFTATATMLQPPPTTPLVDINPGVDFSELGGTGGNRTRHNTNSNASTVHQPPPPSYQPRRTPLAQPIPPPQPPQPPQPPPRQAPKGPTGPLYGQVGTPSSARRPSRPPARPPSTTVGGWSVHSKCDIKDRFTSRYTKRQVTQWRRGRIVAIHGSKILVTFDGWGEEHDMWINHSKEPGRLAPYGSKTAQVEQQRQYSSLSFREQMEATHQLQVVTMRGDGNCLFRSVAHQIWGDPELHAMVRTMVCDFMLANRGEFAEVLGALVPGPNGFEKYVAQMRQPCYQGSGEWGGDPEIRVMEEIFDRPFELWDVDRGAANGPANIHLEGSLPKNHRVDPIRVSYHGKNHYNSVMNRKRSFPLGELNTSNIRNFRKKDTGQRNFDTGYK